MAISIHNATARRIRSGLKMSEKTQFQGLTYFSTKYLRPYPQNHIKTPFWGPFNAKPIIQIIDIRKSHVNGATKVKIYSYIGIGKYLGCVKFFSGGGRPGGAGPFNVNSGPHIISKTTRARKLTLKTQLDAVKYSVRVQFFSARWRPGGAWPPNVNLGPLISLKLLELES